MLLCEDPLLTSLGDSPHPMAVFRNFLNASGKEIKHRLQRIARLKKSMLISAAGLVLVTELESAATASELLRTRVVWLLDLAEQKSSPADLGQIFASILRGAICVVTSAELAFQKRFAWVDSLPPSLTSRFLQWASGDFEDICIIGVPGV